MMELVLKTIIGPIVVGVVLRLVDKWLNLGVTQSGGVFWLYFRLFGSFLNIIFR